MKGGLGERELTVGRIKRAAGQATRLIEDLLDVTRLEAGRLDLDRRPHPIDAIVEEVVELHNAEASERGLRLELEVQGDLPNLDCDRHRIIQVLSNLVGNAIKFTEAGVVRLEAAREGSELRFRVSDTGPGIPEEIHGRIFERFWRPQGERRSGAGLGLAIAKGVAEAHGGRIWVESKIGGGSTFEVALPLL